MGLVPNAEIQVKVRCPKCHVSCTIDSRKLPEPGAYAKCPKCQERFFIKKADSPPPRKPPRPSSLAPSQRPAAAEPEPPTANRQPPPEDDLVWEDQYSIGIIEDDFKAGWLILIGVVVVGLAILILMSLHRPATDVAAKQKPQIEEPQSGQDDQAKLAQDLIFIRMKINRRNFTDYVVEDDGPEFRFLTAMVEECGGECWGLYYARIMPLDNRMGFEADMQCYQPGEHTVTYMWATDDLSVDYSPCLR